MTFVFFMLYLTLGEVQFVVRELDLLQVLKLGQFSPGLNVYGRVLRFRLSLQ
jgi:hypothetical protein